MAEEVVIKTVLDLSGSEQRTQRQIEKALKAAEVKTLAHQRRLEAIHLQSGTRLEQIEARRQAQLDLVRERAVQREIARQRQLENSMRSSGGALIAILTATAAAGLAAGAAIKKFAEISIQAAIDVNKQVNTLKALTGSAEAAEKRFAALFAIAQKTPGLTTNLALTLDAQLRIFNVAEKTIDRLLPVIGRLNAISPIADPRQFVNNLTQLISQNFERQDLKELVGQSPIAGLLIKEIFNVDNPTNAAAIRTAAKRLGITTVERLAEEFADAGANNAALRNATESFAGQFEKLQDRITVALAPIGEEILKTLLPAFQQFVTLMERDLPKITALLRDSREELAAVAAAFLTVANSVSVLGQALGVLTQQSGIIRNLALLATAIGAPGALPGVISSFNAVDQARATDNARRARINQRLGPFGDIDEITGFLRTPTPARTAGRIGGGAGSAAARRFVADFGLGDAEQLRHEAELARIRQSIAATIARRQAPPGGIGLPTLPLTAAGAPDIAGLPTEELRELARAADDLERLPHLLSDSERLMRGFASATRTVGDAFEQLGADVAFAFTNVKSLFDGLKRAVLDFFNNLLGTALQNLVRNTLGGIFGSLGGGLGNLFRTPSFAGGFGGGGGGSSLPFPGAQSPEFFNVAGGVGGSSFLGGIGKSFAGAAPLLGLGLGGGLGGPSILGQIAGSAGGLLGGGAIAGFSGALGAKATAFFTNPFTIAIGAGLLVGSFFLGRAKQRRSDEELSGQYLTQALQGIEQLAQAVASGQITTLGEARSVFDTQILGTFRQQIGQLKTKSVRESRLTNQVRDLENVFNARIPPLITENERRAAELQSNALTHSRLIPEFATGGTARGGLAFLHPGEKILNFQQQAAVIGQSNPRVFERAGVPGVRAGVTAFPHGGTYGGGGLPPQVEPINITLEAQVVISDKTATGIYVVGGSTSRGRAVTVNNVKIARTNREL